LKLSEGAIANMLVRAEKPFAAHASEIAETVRTSPVIASETSARVCGKTHWHRIAPQPARKNQGVKVVRSEDRLRSTEATITPMSAFVCALRSVAVWPHLVAC
jgi:hypothetical protein